jgi:orotidine-5'-phosphate decarboxylase
MINVHAAGGIAMMRAAFEAAEMSGYMRPIIIAVTQLTSTGQNVMNQELLIPGTVEHVVLAYAKNAKAAGLDGVVCSPLETALIKKQLGKQFLTVTPGIRFPDGEESDDQVRITTPAQAGEDGTDYIVVGRPITRASDPLEAYVRCVNEFLGKSK